MATAHASISDMPLSSKARSTKPMLAGLAGTALMAVIFSVVLTLVRGPAHVLTQFSANWPWLVPIMAGFGIQVGLYSWIRSELARRAAVGVTAEVAASGGASTVSMVTCCAHHLGEVLPALGLGAVGALLGAYQAPLVALGLGSNAVGIAHMLVTAKQHHLTPENAFGRRLFAFDLGFMRRAVVAVTVIAVAASLAFAAVRASEKTTARQEAAGAASAPGAKRAATGAAKAGAAKAGAAKAGPPVALPARPVALREQIREAGGLEVLIRPQPVRAGRAAVFGVGLSVHEGSIDFDPAKLATLTDDLANTYKGRWVGDPPGGHEREGILRFPALKGEPRRLTLTIKNAWGVPERTFTWTLR